MVLLLSTAVAACSCLLLRMSVRKECRFLIVQSCRAKGCWSASVPARIECSHRAAALAMRLLSKAMADM